jgi:hypothetical protein
MEWYEIQFHPIKQLFLIIIGVLLCSLYIIKPFKNEEYNKLSLAYGIFILGWVLTIIFRYVLLSYYPQDSSQKKLIVMPYGLKCLFGDNGCQNADFTFFSVIHIVGYILIGYFVPNQYLVILIISFLCEFLEYMMGYQAKFVLDPIINIFGYFIGNMIYQATHDDTTESGI